MPAYRFYLDTPFLEGAIVSLTGPEHHHLAIVQRARVGNTLELINGRNQLAKGTVYALHKKEAEIKIDHLMTTPPSPRRLILALALPRMNHLEWVIEKGTELNATDFWLFPGLLSEKEELSHNQMQRLKHLSIAAMKQCGRLDLPSIEMKPPLLQWKPIDGLLLFGETKEEAPYLSKMKLPPYQTLCIAIGPESGFDLKETAYLKEALNAQGVCLHPNILRAETAPIVALSLIQA